MYLTKCVNTYPVNRCQGPKTQLIEYVSEYINLHINDRIKEYEKVKQNIKDLLMNKYTISPEERTYLFSSKVTTDLLTTFIDYTYPISQEEFNIYYMYLDITYVRYLKFNLDQYIMYYNTYSGIDDDTLHFILENDPDLNTQWIETKTKNHHCLV